MSSLRFTKQASPELKQGERMRGCAGLFLVCVVGVSAFAAQNDFRDIVVNGEKIAGSRLERLYKRSIDQLPAGKYPPEFYERLRETARQETVQQTVLRQYIEKQKIVATAQGTADELANLKIRLQAGGMTYESYLKMRGQSEAEFSEEITYQVALVQFCAGGLDMDKLKAGFEKDKKTDNLPLRRASHVLFMHAKVRETNSKRSADDAKKLAQRTLDKARRGDDFSKLAQESSDCPSKEQGGDLGWFAPSQMVKAFSEAVYALRKPGDIGAVVESEFGFHVIKLTGLHTEEEAWKTFQRASAEAEAQKIMQKLLADAQVTEQ